MLSFQSRLLSKQTLRNIICCLVPKVVTDDIAKGQPDNMLYSVCCLRFLSRCGIGQQAGDFRQKVLGERGGREAER